MSNYSLIADNVISPTKQKTRKKWVDHILGYNENSSFQKVQILKLNTCMLNKAFRLDERRKNANLNYKIAEK